MSGEAGRRVLCQDVDVVQNLIERCLQLYMSQKEVVETLSTQAKIEPDFTKLVWKKLEEENQEFFKAYHVRMMVKHQIMIFNELLKKQVELMQKMSAAEVASQPTSIGYHSSSHQTSSCFVSDHILASSRSDDIPHQSGLSTMLRNDRQMMQGSMHSSDDASVHTGTIDVLPIMPLTNNSHLGAVSGVNGAMIKSESDYSYSSAFTFGNTGNVHEMHPTIEVPASSRANAQPDPLLSSSHLDVDNSLFGFSGQIPCNFSLSDLAGGFSQS